MFRIDFSTHSRQSLWRFAWIAGFLFFAVTRYADLGARPMHNDESVNAMFVFNLIKSHAYQYDPSNFHGPALYFIHAVPAWILSWFRDGLSNLSLSSTSGIDEVSLRAVEATAGMLLLFCCLALRRRIGEAGAFAAFLLLGFSPDILYFSRYFIHEIFLVLFTFCLYLSAVRLKDTKRPRYAYLAAASAALMYATKETSVMHFFVMGFSYYCAEWTQAAMARQGPGRRAREATARVWSGLRDLRWHIAGAAAAGLAIWFLLYSSFFTNWPGLLDSVKTYVYWGPEGVDSGHNKYFDYFFREILFPYEPALVVAAFVGMIAAFVRNDGKGLYLIYWTLGTLGAYSVVPYKTPWCVINLLLPMAVVGGYGVHSILRYLGASGEIRDPARIRTIGAAGFALLLLIQSPQTYNLVYKDHDQIKHVQVYQHTDRDAYNLIDDIFEMAERSREGKKVRINVLSKEQWPLPYYLRNFAHVAYWGTEQIDNVDAPIMVAHVSQKDAVLERAKNEYVVREFTFRHGVRFALFVEKDVYESAAPNAPRDLPDVMKGSEISGGLRPGLIRSAFKGMRFRGDPIDERRGLTETSFRWNHGEKPYAAPFSLRWTGYLSVPTDGETEFSLTSDDGSMLYLNGYLVIDNSGTHAPVEIRKTVRLEAGLHKFELEYFDWLGEAILDLRWVLPGEAEAPIPPDAFFYPR